MILKIFFYLLLSFVFTIEIGCSGCSNSGSRKTISRSNSTLQSVESDEKAKVIIQIETDSTKVDSIEVAPKFKEPIKNDNSTNYPEYKVIGVIDGDTYDILKDNTPVRIRMEGIDTPEKGMPFCNVAKKYLSSLIFGKIIQVNLKEKDRDGRYIADTFLTDGTDISLEMLKSGLAWHFKKYNNNKTYSEAEIEAKNANKGLWLDKNPIAPWEIRKLHKNGVSTKKMFENNPNK